MELLWYRFVKLDGCVELIPERAIVRVEERQGEVHVYLSDGSTIPFQGTADELFGSIAAEMIALGITIHTIEYQEPAS